jgi:hypothetical protein
MKYIFTIVVLFIFFTNYTKKSLDNIEKDRLFTMFKISKDSVFFQHDVINEKLITYDTINKQITLSRFDNQQKQLSIGKILSVNNPPYTAYLVEIQERLSNVFTIIIYLDIDDIAPIYLLNYKDTVLIDYLYHDGSYVYDVIEDNDKEIIYSYQRWFEFHQDTVYKIENNIQDDYYAYNRKQIERCKDSIITKYKIEEDGVFTKVYCDSILCINKDYKNSF